MASIGSLVADMALKSAAFERNLQKTTSLLKKQTAIQKRALREVQNASRGVNRAFRTMRAGAASLAGALAVRQFQGFTKAALDNADALNKQARRIGLAAEALQEFRIRGEVTGVTIQQMDASAAQFIKKVGELRAGTGTLTTFLDKANVSLKNQLLAANSTGEALDIMLTAIARAPNDFDRLALSAAAFGRTAGTNMVLLAESTGTVSDEMVAVTLRSNEMLAASEQLNDQVTLLQRAFQAGFDTEIVLGMAGAVDASAASMREAREIGQNFGHAVGVSMRGVAAAAEFVARNIREIAAVLAALIAMKAAAVFVGMAVAVGKFVVATAAAAKGARLLSIVMRANLITAVAQVAAMAAAAALAYEAFGASIDDVIVDVTKMGQTIASGGTPAVAAHGKAVEDVVKQLRIENEELTALEQAHRGLRSDVWRTNTAIETTNQLRAAGVDIMSAEGREISDLVFANAELRRSIDALTEAEAERVRAAEQAAEDLKRAREEEARLMQQPFLNAIDGIQDSFADFFTDVFDGGVDSFEKLSDALKRIMVRTAGEIAALLVFRPVVGGVLNAAGLGGLAGQLGASASSLPGGGGGGFGFGVPSIPGLDSLFGSAGSLTTALNSFGASLGFAAPGGAAANLGVAAVPGGLSNAASTGGLFGSTTFSSFLGGAGLGFGAGSLLNSLVGGNPVGGTIGSGVGAAAGAAIGSAILPGVGTILGGLIGGGGGGLFGGLFGGDGRTVGPNAVASLGVSNGALVFGTANADNGGNRAEAERFARDVASTFNAITEALGAEIINAGVNQVGTFGGQFRVGRAYNEGRLDRALGTDYRSAVEQSVLFGFSGSQLGGIDPALGDAVRRAGQISKDLDEFSANVSLAQAILGDELFDVEEITQAEQAIKDLEAAFEDAASRAEALGLEVTKIEELHAKALQDLTEGFDDAIQLSILGFTDPMQAALDDLAKTQEERLKEAKALGADLVALEKLNALERARVIEQSNNGLSDFLNEITFGGLSGAAPGNALSGARGAFEAAVAQGASAQRIITLGREFIGASRSFNASSTNFFDDLARVQAVVQSRIGGAGGANDNTAAAIAAASDRQAFDAVRIIDALNKGEEGQAAVITALEDILAELKKQAA